MKQMEETNKDYYFIDDNIWYQGELQPPRKVKCYNLSFIGNKAHFYDEDGNVYLLDDYEVLPEDKANEKISVMIPIYNKNKRRK